MFSKEFMRYLINYQPDGCECNEKNTSTVKEIEFKNKGKGTPVHVWVNISTK